MSYPRIVLPLVLFSLSASAQSVVSALSGVIHYSEGAVFLDNQPIEQKFGRFNQVKEGSELRTDNGRAEILLTPGTFLRVGENSAIRMVSNRLSDTRVELLRGSASVESVKVSLGTSVTIRCRDSETRFHRAGLYRFKADPAEVRVEQGEAEVTKQGESKTIAQGQVLSLANPAAATESITGSGDTLDRWTMRRSIAVAADDAAAQQADDMAVLLDPSGNPYSLGPGGGYYGGVYSSGIGAYPLGYGGTYLGLGAWGSPFFLPRFRVYSPTYLGYPGYRPGNFSLSPVRTIVPPAFHPAGRVFTTPARPTVTLPSVPRPVGGRAPIGHR